MPPLPWSNPCSTTNDSTLTLRLLAIVLPALDAIPRGHAGLVDQIRRAAISIPLNIAEGAGKTSTADRRRYYATARGSAMECAAVVDVARLLGILDATLIEQAKTLAERVLAMLSKLSRSSS